MKRRTSILVCALLGVMVAGQAMAATLRYQNSGDYFATVAVTGSYGWQAGGGGPGGLPGAADTIRCNWGNNLVTLTNVAPLINNFQLGVDESGRLEVDAGGLLQATALCQVGNNNNCTGQLTVNTGGEVDVTNVLEVGAGTSSATATYGILTINGGTVRATSHLWVGCYTPGVGTIYITNGGSLNIGGNIGLGTINASTASGGKGSVFVQDGGVLNLSQISSVNSIQPSSVLDISGSGVVIIPNNLTAVMSAYTNAVRITAYGGLGTVGIDYNNTNAGKTTLFAIAPLAPPPTDVVWNPAANPSGTGKWNEKANWTGGVVPASVTEVEFNVPNAIPCTVTNVAFAGYLDMGDTGPGGTLIITNGGSLTCGAASWTVIGDSYNALMDVETGGSVSIQNLLYIGVGPGAEGTLIMNGGTVSVAFGLYLGYQGGTGTVEVHGGTLKISMWDDSYAIQGNSVLDVAGTGVVVLTGYHQSSVDYYVSTGQITNSGGGTVMVDFNNINAGATTIYPSGLYLPPVQEAWNPALNPVTDGLWNDPTNWSGDLVPGNVTYVSFNVAGAIPCIVTNAMVAGVVRIDQSGGGTLIITNGGSLICSAADWCCSGYGQTGNLLDVENGGSFSCASHLWVGFNTGGSGTLIMNGGTVSVGQMFGWGGGTGTAQINGGTLNLSQWSASNPGSIAGASVLNVAGTGKVVITGNYVASVSNYVSSGQITANGGPNVFYFYDAGANKTTISAVLLPPPQQAITAVSVSGGNVTITYQTTQQHTYHIESTPSLSPTSWTPVTGSTNAATGAPVTFTFPAGSGQMFYRTVSP
jgi:hypothetical protein